MVSFRYHVVSIVAVFLALGLGVLMGTTVVKQSVINTLRSQADNAITTNHRLSKDISDLRSQLNGWQAFAGPAQRLLVNGQLDGRTVVLITADGVAPSVIDGVRRALGDAGATVSGVLRVTSRMQLADDGSRTRLAATLGLPDTTAPQDLVRQAAESLAVRLSQGPPQPAGVQTPDLLDQLSADGLVQHPELDQGVAQVGGSDQAVIVLTGGTGVPAADPQAFFAPLVQSLVLSGQPVAAGQTSDSAYDVVGLVRRNATVVGLAVTVDDAVLVAGRVALVIGLRDLMASNLGPCGDFGIKAGACATLPPPTAS
jgi:hypothetical protein